MTGTSPLDSSLLSCVGITPCPTRNLCSSLAIHLQVLATVLLLYLYNIRAVLFNMAATSVFKCKLI
jgi:hypothetical protein